MPNRRQPLLIAFVVAAVAVLASWWLAARPVPIPDGGPGRLQCVSYAPSGGSYRPLREVTVANCGATSPYSSQRTGCVRTYTVSDGFDQVPAVARELGLQVILGAWISGNAEQNDREVALAIEVANRHRDTIRAIVVGNEVMLRHELPPDQLAALIRRVADATGLPVTYADVWGFWLKHRVLSQSVSFITVHIIPYWDDDPVGIDEVIALRRRAVRGDAATLPRQGGADRRDGLAERRTAARRDRPGRVEPGALRARVHRARRRARHSLQPDRGVRPALETRARRHGRRALGPVRPGAPREIPVDRTGGRGAAGTGDRSSPHSRAALLGAGARRSLWGGACAAAGWRRCWPRRRPCWSASARTSGTTCGSITRRRWTGRPRC